MQHVERGILPRVRKEKYIATEIDSSIGTLDKDARAPFSKVKPYGYRHRPIGAAFSSASTNLLDTNANLRYSLRKDTQTQSTATVFTKQDVQRQLSRPSTRMGLTIREGKFLFTEPPEREYAEHLQSSFFNAIVFRKKKTRDLLTKITHPEGYQILAQDGFEFSRILLLLRNIFPEIEVFAENFLGFEHKTAKTILVYFTGGEYIPVSLCCNSTVVIELSAQKGGRIICQGSNCRVRKLHSFNVGDINTLWENVRPHERPVVNEAERQITSKEITNLVRSNKHRFTDITRSIKMAMAKKNHPAPNTPFFDVVDVNPAELKMREENMRRKETDQLDREKAVMVSQILGKSTDLHNASFRIRKAKQDLLRTSMSREDGREINVHPKLLLSREYSPGGEEEVINFAELPRKRGMRREYIVKIAPGYFPKQNMVKVKSSLDTAKFANYHILKSEPDIE